MKRQFLILLWASMIALAFVASCDEKGRYVEPDDVAPTLPELAGFYICCEGLWSGNNGTLAYYDAETGTLEKNFFEMKNGRGLGDTPNDLALYGSKLYCVVSISSRIEVIDAATGMSIKQIPMTNDEGNARQPRFITFHKDKGYVCCFDGVVARIDTASLEVEAVVRCGRNPDGMAVANGKLYVSNSGGLDFPNYDTTVSVIELDGFTETTRITVASNPSYIHCDSEGDLYLVSRNDNNYDGLVFQKIDSKTDKLTATFEGIHPTNFTISNDTAYIYSYDYALADCRVMTFDCKADCIINEQVISATTAPNIPYGIDINPVNGDIYLADAYNYVIRGDVLCYKRDGTLRFKLSEVGLNPKKVVFVTKE